MRVVILVFFAAIFLGPYGFIFYEKLHLIRVFPLLIILILFYVNVKINKLGQFFIAFYLIYIVYTILISLLHLDYILANDIVNLAVLLLYVIAIILLISYNKELFLSQLTGMCWLFIIVSIPIIIFELLTWEHLSLSGMANPLRSDFSYFHLPTVFYTNPNDLAFVFVLVTMFLLSREKRNLVVYLLILLCFTVTYMTESRLAFFGFAIFLFFYSDFLKFKSLIFIAFLLFGIVLIFFMYGDFDGSRLFTFEFSKEGSLYRRYYLYLEGLKSVSHNFGTGFGVGGYHHYYSSVVNSWDISTDTDPHNFFIELLINSGLYVAVLYALVQLGILVGMLRLKVEKLLLVQFIVYHILLLSSSSSLFLWPHYLFYFVSIFQIKKHED